MEILLKDIEWLAHQYRTRTLASIAAELGCSLSTVRNRLVAAGVVIRTAASAADERRRSELNDPAWLAARYEHASAADIAADPSNEPAPVAEDPPAPAPVTTERPPDIEPSGPDLNCADISRTVWVGSNDYRGLDANGDGWGCDSYG